MTGPRRLTALLLLTVLATLAYAAIAFAQAAVQPLPAAPQPFTAIAVGLVLQLGTLGLSYLKLMAGFDLRIAGLKEQIGKDLIRPVNERLQAMADSSRRVHTMVADGALVQSEACRTCQHNTDAKMQDLDRRITREEAHRDAERGD